MKHYGDITKMRGDEIEPVWLIVGGSPCQDLSVAGLRKGLSGERSGLFMEMVRIIKEMRKKDEDSGRTAESIRCRWCLWENVPGATSSNSGEDFRCVIEELCRIKDPTVCIPRPSGGKWPNAGQVLGDGYSLAWRIRDAQHWGVPQRRRRIALLVDFSGMDAAKILFEQCSGREPRSEVRSVGESMSGDSEQGSEEGQSTSNGPPGSLGSTGCLKAGEPPSSYTLKIRGGVDIDSYGKRAGKGALIQTELSGTLGVSQDQTLFSV